MQSQAETFDHIQALNESIKCGREIFDNHLIDEIASTLENPLVHRNTPRTQFEVKIRKLYNLMDCTPKVTK